MLDALLDQYYTCGMDNLFISVKFLRAAYVLTKSKTMVHGVCRVSGRGLPKYVIQEDCTKDRKKAEEASKREKIYQHSYIMNPPLQ